VKRFWIKGKLAPCYIGLFPVLARLGAVAYRLELPPSLTGMHNLVYVSQLKKYLKPPTNVIVDDVVPLNVDLSYPEHLVYQTRDKISFKGEGCNIPCIKLRMRFSLRGGVVTSHISNLSNRTLIMNGIKSLNQIPKSSIKIHSNSSLDLNFNFHLKFVELWTKCQ
jgi:hypothetical protein